MAGASGLEIHVALEVIRQEARPDLQRDQFAAEQQQFLL